MKDTTRLQNSELSRNPSFNCSFPDSHTIKEAASSAVASREEETKTSAGTSEKPGEICPFRPPPLHCLSVEDSTQSLAQRKCVSYCYSLPGVQGQGQVVDGFLTCIRATVDLSFFPQVLSEKMFQTGRLVVFCGLLAQTMVLLEALTLPLDQTLPLPMTPPLALSPTDLAGSLTSGK